MTILRAWLDEAETAIDHHLWNPDWETHAACIAAVRTLRAVLDLVDEEHYAGIHPHTIRQLITKTVEEELRG